MIIYSVRVLKDIMYDGTVRHPGELLEMNEGDYQHWLAKLHTSRVKVEMITNIPDPTSLPGETEELNTKTLDEVERLFR